MDAYELGVASAKVYDFIWDTYCDWYIELTKARLYGEDESAQARRAERAGAMCSTETLRAAAPVHAVHHRGNLAGAAAYGRG